MGGLRAVDKAGRRVRDDVSQGYFLWVRYQLVRYVLYKKGCRVLDNKDPNMV